MQLSDQSFSRENGVKESAISSNRSTSFY